VNIKPPENLLQQRFLFSFSKRKPDGLPFSLWKRAANRQAFLGHT